MTKPIEFTLTAEQAAIIAPLKVEMRHEASQPGGAICFGCKQFVKVYKRTINASMAYVLILLHRRTTPGEWIHIQEFLGVSNLPSAVAASGDYAKLRYWGYLEQADCHRADGSARNGYWRITDTGRSFVRGEISAPRVAKIYADTLLKLDDTTRISIKDALGKKHNYDVLMRGE